uniref:Uncharacterized protein n=1 Tax=Parascaris equorum TaxID=6256 RepID=A0A914RL05_PAREQ
MTSYPNGVTSKACTDVAKSDGSGLGDSQKDEGTACRVHGRVRVNKVKGDSVIITAGKGAGIDGLFAHVDGASNG